MSLLSNFSLFYSPRYIYHEIHWFHWQIFYSIYQIICHHHSLIYILEELKDVQVSLIICFQSLPDIK